MRKPFDHDPESVTKARKSAGLTMTALAERLGCSKSLISEIESGTRNARPSLLASMANVLGCSVAELEREPGRQATPPAAVGVRVRDEERAEPEDVPELRGVAVERSA